jgi:FtsP/CotA-like multicopper oxidase with cupredoxin domain
VRFLRVESLLFAILFCCAISAFGQEPAEQVCRRPVPGGTVPEPKDLRSREGVLRVELTYRSSRDAQGRTRFCFLGADGTEAPTLRVSPGDWLTIALKNEAGNSTEPAKSEAHASHTPGPSSTRNPGVEVTSVADASTSPCTSGAMTPLSTNLHFHGLTVPAVCHQEDVLHTTIQPGDAPFEYRFQIPKDEPPGLYWYHPHVHGSTKAQVLGGASGALIIEGIERAKPALAGLRERVFVIRDQNLLNPDAAPSADPGTSIPPVVLDHDGDVMNNGTGTGKPAQDLSVNFVPVPYPDYRPATITMKPGERQLWRVLNASAITYLNLQLLFRGEAQAVEIVAIDGVPLNDGGSSVNGSIWQNHLGVSPGGRVEFIVKGPAAGVAGALITRAVNTGAAGENDPTRPLANIIATSSAAEPASRLSEVPIALPPAAWPWIGKVEPARTRKLYFSEVPQDPHDPNSPTTFYLTVDGQTPKAFDPAVEIPNIVAHQGDVEDWIIENRSQELHDFHIHQAHFLLLEWFGLPVNEGFLRDTINVPYWDGKNPVYPRIKLRMDFRDPNVVGLFPYHCHLLEHEDAGMMGLIRVEPREPSQSKAPISKSPAAAME